MLSWYVIVRYTVWCLVLLSQRLHRVSLFSIHKSLPLTVTRDALEPPAAAQAR